MNIKSYSINYIISSLENKKNSFECFYGELKLKNKF